MSYHRHFRHAVIAAAAVLVTACGDSDETAPASTATTSGAGGQGGAGGGGGSGGSVDCLEGSHDDGTGACVTTLAEWAAGSPLEHARDHHVTFAATTPAGSFLYVVGGTTGLSILDGVESSPIAADGSLAGFADAAGKLPRAVLGPGLAQVDASVVLAGGLAVEAGHTVSVTDTAVGIVADDGSVGFAAGPPLGVSRYHVTLSADRGFVYAIGGLNQTFENGMPAQALADAVERAAFDGTTLGAFTELAPLPEGLTHHAAVVRDHALYLIGGISGSAARTDILRATVAESGDLGAWDTAGQLPEGRATSSAFVFLDHLYVIAGATKAMGGEVATVLRAPFDESGAVGAFEELTPLPLARAHAHQTPVLHTHLYSAGGSIDHKVQDEVFVGRLE